MFITCNIFVHLLADRIEQTDRRTGQAKPVMRPIGTIAQQNRGTGSLCSVHLQNAAPNRSVGLCVDMGPRE